MKHTFYSLLPLFLLLDLVIPFLLAPTYPGYRHTRQVMSVLGNRSAPFHTVYTLWPVSYTHLDVYKRQTPAATSISVKKRCFS